MTAGMLVGVTAGGIQSEGIAPTADWALDQRTGVLPASGEGNGFATNYADEFAGYAEQGLTGVRLTLDWTRLEPAAGKWQRDRFEHDRRVIEAAKTAGLAVWLTLQQQTLPGWFTDEGSFSDDKARGYYWPRYVDRCAEEFGDMTDAWIPFDEPTAWAADAYLTGRATPHRAEPRLFGEALRGAWLAWRDASRLLRGSRTPVVTALNVAPAFCVDNSVPGDTAVRRANELMWDLPVRAIRDGELLVPGRYPEEVAELRGSADIIGISCSAAIGYRQPDDPKAEPNAVVTPYPPQARVDATGFAPWAEALGLALHRIADDLPGLPVAVTAWGVATKHDEWREQLLREVGGQLRLAVDDRIAVCAFFHRSGVDGYEARRGFAGATGVFTRDRNPKPSVEALAALAAISRDSGT